MYPYRVVKMIQLLCLCLLIPASFALPPRINQPCALNDYQCIGQVLAGNSLCNPQVVGAIAGNYSIISFPFVTPYFNATYIDQGLSIANHDKCYVTKFYQNLENDNGVLAIRCPGLVFQSTRTYIQHIVEAEDEIYSYDYKGTYPEIILTVNLRPSHTINLCTASVFAYVSALPIFDIKPNNKETDDYLTRDLTFLNIYERETFAERAGELFRFFINSLICNFGCDF